ncbi:MAG: type II toxin-antitoxin system MqsA family antitoxin [Anaerolineales bacterium]
MICLICRQADVVGGFTSVKFERGETHLIINNVPARLCRGCGEAYVDEGITRQLLRILKERSEAGMPAGECEYTGPQG